MYLVNIDIPLSFTLFQDYSFNFCDDIATDIRYRNLFDMMVDEMVTTMVIIEYEKVPFVVTKTRWLSSLKDATEVDAALGM